jgi:antitoxin CcdA
MPITLSNAHRYAYPYVKLIWRLAMADLYDLAAPKKATNLSLNSDLLERARELKVNLSATLEQALSNKLKSVEAEKWKRENKAAVEAYNEFIAENGCLSDEYREF